MIRSRIAAKMKYVDVNDEDRREQENQYEDSDDE